MALEALVPRAADGDRAALAEILALIRPLMRRYCANRLGLPGELHVTADDVAQEICLATISALPRYRDQGKSFLAFVYGIAANKVADARRRAQIRSVHSVDDLPEQVCPDHGPEELALAGEQRAGRRKLMDVLTPRHKEVLVMRVVMGMSAAQTADLLGTTPGVVRVMQHRALNRLRTELSAKQHDVLRVRARSA